MAKARAASAAACVVVAGLLAGCGGSSGGATKSPPPWSDGVTAPDGMVKGTVPDDRKVVAGDVWSFTLPDKTDANVPTSQWPSADSVLTADQLKAAVPEATAVTLGDCVKGTSGPHTTSKNASCKWSLQLKDSAGYTNSITVTIVAIGADGTGSGVTSAWTSVRDKKFSGRANSERFFSQGSFGTKGAYYLDNNQSSVLLSDGNIAAWIDLTFNGFNTLSDAHDTLVNGIFPVLAKDLSSHLPRKYA